MKRTFALLFVVQTLLASASFAAGVRWKAAAFRLPDATENAAFIHDLSKDVKSTSPALKFVMMAGGPSWLKIAPNGVVSGTPTATNTGKNVFTIQVTDGMDSGDTAQITVFVRPGAKPALTCGDGSAAYLIGHSEDRKHDFFSCNH